MKTGKDIETIMMEAEMGNSFCKYLAGEFGSAFLRLVQPPKDINIGERVLYVLKDDQVASRKEVNQSDLDEFHDMLVDISQKTGGTVKEVKSPVSSGLPYPRTVDIHDWSKVALDRKYFDSGELIPEGGFSILWLFGLVFWNWSKQLVFIDFRHPKVKAVFSVEYDVEHDFSAGRDMEQRLRLFRRKLEDLVKDVDSREDVLWVKFVQLDSDFLVRMTTK